MNLDIAKERLLEIENLTDQLTDDDANWLINWSIGKMVLALEESSSAEQADRVIGMARTLNQSATNPSADSVAHFLQQYQETFNTPVLTADPQAVSHIMTDLSGKSPREVMQQMVALAPRLGSHSDIAAETPQTTLQAGAHPDDTPTDAGRRIEEGHRVSPVPARTNPFGYPTDAASILAEEGGKADHARDQQVHDKEHEQPSRDKQDIAHWHRPPEQAEDKLPPAPPDMEGQQNRR